MSAFEATCPDCNGPLETRRFQDGGFLEGKPAEFNQDWWCPACRRRWVAFETEPEAEG